MKLQSGDPGWTTRSEYETLRGEIAAAVESARGNAMSVYRAASQAAEAEYRGSNIIEQMDYGARKGQEAVDAYLREAEAIVTDNRARQRIEGLREYSRQIAEVNAQIDKRSKEAVAGWWKQVIIHSTAFFASAGGAFAGSAAGKWLGGSAAASEAAKRTTQTLLSIGGTGAGLGGGHAAGAAIGEDMAARRREEAQEAFGRVQQTNLSARQSEESAKSAERNLLGAVNSARLAAFGGTPGAAVGAPRLERGSLTGSQAGEGSI